jgi:hypothetical protein
LKKQCEKKPISVSEGLDSNAPTAKEVSVSSPQDETSTLKGNSESIEGVSQYDEASQSCRGLEDSQIPSSPQILPELDNISDDGFILVEEKKRKPRQVKQRPRADTHHRRNCDKPQRPKPEEAHPPRSRIVKKVISAINVSTQEKGKVRGPSNIVPREAELLARSASLSNKDSTSGLGKGSVTVHEEHKSRLAAKPDVGLVSPSKSMETLAESTICEEDAGKKSPEDATRKVSELSPETPLGSHEKAIKMRNALCLLMEKKMNQEIQGTLTRMKKISEILAEHRFIAFNRVNLLLQNLFPGFVIPFTCNSLDCKVCVQVYGSCATGLALACSDIDISVTGLKCANSSDTRRMLEIIAEELLDHPFIKNVQTILSATIPIIKFEIDTKISAAHMKIPYGLALPTEMKPNVDIFSENDSIVKIDLTVGTDDDMFYPCPIINPGSVMSSTYFTMKMLFLFPQLANLMILFKRFLAGRDFNIPRKGTASFAAQQFK